MEKIVASFSNWLYMALVCCLLLCSVPSSTMFESHLVGVRSMGPEGQRGLGGILDGDSLFISD